MSFFFFSNEQATLDFGVKLGQASTAPLVIFLEGELGTGKTTLARGFLRGLGYTGKVKSPSYTLVESYDLGEIQVFHFDFYRIHGPQELEFIGLQDYWQPKAIFLVEWPEQAAPLLPSVDLSCSLTIVETGRQLALHAKSERGDNLLSRL